MAMRKSKNQAITLLVLGLFLLDPMVTYPPWSASIVGSKHDLSTNWDPYSTQVCAFCHTPHFANPSLPIQAPLWNRAVDLDKVFQPYSSPTMNTTPGNPQTTISMLCLGCHDGTVGWEVIRGNNVSDKHDLINAPGPGGIPDTTSWPNCQRCHPEYYGDPPAFWQGTDLRDDHPIAMLYPTAAQDPKFNLPPDLSNGWSDVKLYSGRVECPTCHQVHDPGIPPFMRKSNQGSALCLTCHIK